MKKIFPLLAGFIVMLIISVGFSPEPVTSGIDLSSQYVIDNSNQVSDNNKTGDLRVIYVQTSFEESSFPPTGWTDTAIYGSTIWDRVTVSSYPSGVYPHTGTYMARYYCWGSPSGYIANLITPSFDLSGAGGNAVVDFWMYRENGYAGTYFDTLAIWVSTTKYTTSGATLLAKISRVYPTAGWYNFVLPIPSSYNGTVNYVIFQALSGYGYDLHIDDVKIGVPDPMSLTSLTNTQITGGVLTNSINNPILRLNVATSGALNPFNISSFKFTTTGTTNPATDIRNAKVFYTGSNPVFSSSSQYGSTVQYPNGVFYITGSQTLSEGNNYFWLTYDIPAGATQGNFVDATCDSVTGSGTMGTVQPVPPAPAGNRQIVGPMAGNYIIGPTPSDYPNFTSAIGDLTTRGVSGAVTFHVKPAVYGTTSGTEVDSVLTFTPVNGASATNTVTFKKKSDETGEVWVERYGTSATTDYIIQLSGTKYFTFDSINVRQKDTALYNMVDWGYSVTNPVTNVGAQYNTIKNCKIFLKGTNTSTRGISHYNLTNPTLIEGTNSYNTYSNNTILNARTGIYIYGYSASTPYSLYDKNNSIIGNNIVGLGNGGGTTYAYGIYSYYQGSTFRIVNNNIFSAPDNAYYFYGIYTNYGYDQNVDIIGNTINANYNTSYPFYGIYSYYTGALSSPVMSNTVNINNNTITANLGSTFSTTFYGIDAYYCYADTLNMVGNAITGTNIPGSGTAYGFYIYYWGNNLNFSSNVIQDIYRASSGAIYPAYIYSSNMENAKARIFNNTFNNIRSVSGSNYGLYLYGRNTQTNFVYNNNFINWVTGTGSLIYGFYNANSLTTHFYNNNIYNLRDSAYTSGYVYNIYQVSGTNSYYYNNFISNSRANSSSSNLANVGFYINGGTFNGIYYNSIYLADTSTSTSYGSAGIYLAGSYYTEARNNNIINISKPGNGTYTAKTSGIRLGSNTYLPYYSIFSGNNNIYCGSTSDTGRVIYYDGPSRFFTLQTYKNYVNPREQSSISEMPVFSSASTGDLHINGATPTLLYNGALSIAPPYAPISITQDKDGNARSDPFADIGADEFSGTMATDIVQPTIVYDKLGNGSVVTSRQFSNVLILDPSGVNSTTYAPRVYYKKSTNANTFNDNTSATDGWKYAVGTLSGSSFTFTIDYTKLYGGSVSSGDIIQYFVVAQDNASTPNVGINSGVFTTTPTSVALTAANFPITGTINQYNIVASGLSSTVYVGTGQTYTSLTGTGGLFAAINSGVLTGNLNVVITSDLVEPGTYQLQNWSEQYAPATYKITIRPDGTTIRNIYGWVANTNGLIRLYGVNNVTIDGSYGGSGRYLRFVNRTGGSYPTISFTYGCTYDTLRNCIIEGVNTSTTSGIVLIGTGVTTAPQQANNYLTISGNLIRDLSDSLTTSPYIGICNYGSAIPVLNSYNNIINNEIMNCFYYGIYMTTTGSGDGWVIKKNSIYYVPGTYTLPLTNASWYGIYIYPSYYGNGYTIDSNYIGGSQAQAGGSYMQTQGLFHGIYVGAGYNAQTTIRGNVVKNIRSTYITASTTIYYGIAGVLGWLNISGNTVGSADSTERLQMNGLFRAIQASPSYYAGNPTLIVNDNTINNIWTRPDSTIVTLTGNFSRYGIVLGGYLPTECKNNVIMNILSWQSPGATSYNCFHMGILPNVYNKVNVENNYIYNIANLVTAAPTGTGRILVYGIQPIYLGDGSTVAGNRISKIYSSTINSSGDLVIGIYNAASYYGMTTTIYNNQISMTDNNGSWANVVGAMDVSSNAGYCNWFYNTIVLGGTAGSGNPYNSYAYYRATTSGLATYSILRNNLLYNLRTGGSNNNLATGVQTGSLDQFTQQYPYALADEEMLPTSMKGGERGTSPYFLSDYNFYVAPNADKIGDWYGTFYNLSGWKTASGEDANSSADTVANAPASQLFRNYGNADLNIDTTQAVSILVAKRGLGITGITNDYNGYPRSQTGPTCIGSHEFNYTKPIVPSLVSPSNGATGIPIPVVMKWNKTIFASGYQLQISTDSTFGTTVKDTIASDSVYTFYQAVSSTKYFWRVRTVYAQYGVSQYSPIWNFTPQAAGPLTGIKYIPGDYPSIPAAITDLNTYGVGTGGVTFRVATGHIDTAANLVINARGTASNQIVFEKWGTLDNPLPNPLIVAAAGTGTMDGIIKFNGVSYITFDGIDLAENPANTTTTTQMEWGYALLKASADSGSQNITIKNCNITLKKTNTSSVGIYSANHTISSTSSLTITSFSGTNSSNKFYNNYISNCYIGIWVGGFADGSLPYAFYDHFNQIGVQGGNTIRNFGGSSVTTYGIYSIYQDSLSISNNDIGGGTGTTTTNYGIFISICYNSSITVYNNTVSDTNAVTTSSSYGIGLSNAGYNGVDNTVIVKRNTVQGMTTTAVTSGSLYGYYLYYVTSMNFIVDSNKFINNKWGGTTQTATGTIYGFYIYPYSTTPPVGSVGYVTNNYFAGNRRIQSTLGSGTLYGMYLYYGQETFNVYNNTIENDTLAVTTGTAYYMYGYNYYSTTVNYYNNVIRNLYKGLGSSGVLYCVYISNAASSGTFNYYNNTVENIYSDGSGSVYGIYNASTAVNKNFYGNIVRNIRTIGSGAVYGYYFSNGTNVNIYRNLVTNLRTGSGSGYGMYVSSGTTNNIYNNFVSDIRSDSSTSAPADFGVYLSGGTTNNLYYNTIYLNAQSMVSGSTFGTAALWASTTPTLDLRNNIIVNVSTPGATGGYTVAYQRNSTTLTTYANTSDYNLFYAGTPASNRLIYYDGTNMDSTLALYKARVTPRDANSVTQNPPFVNVSTRPYDLHIDTALATVAESGGNTVSSPIAITTDFDGQPRYPNPGYPVHPLYPATAPDIGADEFGGKPLDINPPNISYTPLLNTPSLSARTLTATISDPSGVPTTSPGWPILYWKINSGSWNAAAPTTVSYPQYTYTFGGGVVLGDTVFYYIVARDNSTPPNIGAYPSLGAGGFTYDPPAASIPPTNPSSYRISAAPLAGDYTVGLTLFNSIAGKRIYFEKVVEKVIKEVPVEDNNVEEASPGKGQEPKKDATELTSPYAGNGRTKLVTVEQERWIPMENGKVYDGPLYIKKEENPAVDLPDGIMGVYATITAAVNDLNLRGVSANTRFLLVDTSYTTGETYPIVINVQNMNLPSSTKTVTIKPNTGVNATINGNAPSTQIFKIQTSYVTIDGSNTTGGTTRNLSIINSSITAPQVIVIGSVGTTPITNVTVKNCIITNGVNSSSSVIVSDANAPGTAGWFNNIEIINNKINLAYIGIYSIANVATGNGSGLNISNNELNNTLSPVRLVKIYVQGVDGVTVANNLIGNDSNAVDASNITGIWFATGTKNGTISGNTITNLAGYGPPRGIAISTAVANSNISITKNTITGIRTAYSSPPYGIYVFSTTSGVSITKNKIGNMLNSNTGGYGCRGINIATTVSPSNIEIINNFVWNIVATSDASVTYWGIGIALDASISGVTVYFNSVNLYGSYSGYSSSTVHTAFYASSGITALNLRDNIFVNKFDNTASTTDKSYSIYCAGTNAAFTDINYNDYYVSGTPGILGYLGGDKTTLSDWKLATLKDSASISGDPIFVNDSNLHIDSTQVSPVGNAGQYISTVTDDIDDNPRSTVSPDIGADEFNYSSPMLTLNLKVYLEGFWNGTTHVSDTAKVYIANSTSPYAFVDSQKVVLSSSGTATMNFNKASGNYYIVVMHRNHLETWSRLPQSFVAGTPLSYDFTTDSAKAYGYNMKKVGSVWVLYAGDINQDGAVDALDVALFIPQYGNFGYLSGDLNGDGAVDALDVAILISDFGITKSVPTVMTPPDPGQRSRIIEEIRKKYETPKREFKQNTE